jgi:hypothetical protein
MRTICTIVGCDKPHVARGYCRRHYSIWSEHGDPNYQKPEKKCSECNQKHYAKGLCRDCYYKQKGTVGGKDLGGKRCTIADCDMPHYGKGLCRQHYNRIVHAGTLDSKIIPDLPGEAWVEIDRPDCRGLLVSNMGRVKSIRRRDEVLIGTRMTKVNPQEKQLSCIAANDNGHNIIVHMEVLRAFRPNSDGDFQAVFIDGDRSNCRADNLRWYGQDYLVGKAITMAEASDHPLADCFLRFWHGETNALNDWFAEQRQMIARFLRARLDLFGVPYYVDIDDCVQSSIVSIFVGLRRGMIDNLYKLQAWCLGIAKTTLASGIRDLIPAVPIMRAGDDGSEFCLADYHGWCHPSAELQAIYNEEGLEE